MRSLSIVVSFMVCVCPLTAQFATTVVQQQVGDTSGGGVFIPSNILGGPRGWGANAGSIHVLTLGAGGSVTLGFGEAVVDGPGADLVVYENGFFVNTTKDVFAEVVFVEVSSNGVDFARFPSRYSGSNSPHPQLGGLAPGTFSGLGGSMPVFADVTSNTIDPLDPTVAGGDAFDLADLANEPLVVAGLVDLQAILFVRLVDIEAGARTDSLGNVIFDNGTPGSADIDAVGAINRTSSTSIHQPASDLFFDAQGFLRLRLADPDGLLDLDGATFLFSFNVDLVPAAINTIFWVLDTFDGTSIEFRSFIPLQGLGIKGKFAASIRDHTGGFSTDQVALQG